MEEILRDKRFACLATDPKFRRIPKHVRKVKIDKRFQSMFTDEKFKIKYTVDKRGKPINQTSSEDLRKYYDLSSDEDFSDNCPKQEKSKKSDEKNRKKSARASDNINENMSNEDDETDKSEGENFSSNGSLLLVDRQKKNSQDSENEEDSASTSADDENDTNMAQLLLSNKNDKPLDDKIKSKLRDLSVDYARGEGILCSDSSSEDESSEDEDEEEEIEHDWGELDKEAETTEEITHRLAICNMDWDRIRAADLMVLFNSFLPTGGLIHNISIYPSEFGLQRMKQEELRGPIELVESNDENGEDQGSNADEENEEGSEYHMEKLRQYQLNRLKYYYAVVEFDCAATANKVYSECDGLEYESSSTKLDLRFIPDDMTFDHDPKEVCNELPDLTKYQPRQFTTTALQQVKVDLTWDETNPERLEITQKLNSGKLDEIDDTDLHAYLASGTSEDESEDEVKKQLENADDLGTDGNHIDKYKSLLKSIEQAEEEKRDKKVELEFTWGLGVKEETEKLVKEKLKQNENLTPFEQYLEKRKAKKKAKKDLKKNSSINSKQLSDSEGSVPSDIDMNDSDFAEEFKNSKAVEKKHGKKSKIDQSEEDQKKHQAELELLLMDDDNDDQKHHFSMKRIEEAEALTKSKKKRLSRKKKELKAEISNDNFEVNVNDPRFNALFTSHHYNIDPADPHYRKTKGTEALVTEKIKRRKTHDDDADQNDIGGSETAPKYDADLHHLVKSVKKKLQKISK
ncbi:hypothetical protein QAD02_021980 [Eretmocerus hayati]|uniref:Uncharacterized protein n=1 Tax=Eretmocerus hayati TaxID=131215 RepID=A0ACC2PTS1_9HYME|nr:hypothetical protein QAD02_021980 [Eretmocerus hayati]